MQEFMHSMLAGGATGFLGTALSGVFAFFNRREERKQKELDHAHELSLRKLDMDHARVEAEGQISLAKVQASAARDVADSRMVEASYMAASSIREPEDPHWWSALVYVVRSLMRPGLTLMLVSAVVLMWVEIWNQTVTLAARVDMAEMIAHALVYAAVTSTIWWFGSRHVDSALGSQGSVHRGRAKGENPLSRLKL